MEYALNDFQDAGQALGNWDNHTRRAVERLLRKLLQYPKRPALIMLGAFPHRYYDPGCAQTPDIRRVSSECSVATAAR